MGIEEALKDEWIWIGAFIGALIGSIIGQIIWG